MPNKPITDLTGQRYGRLEVLAFSGMDSKRKSTWRTRCECGTELIVRGNSLRTGNTKSCGCQKRESNRAPKSHGLKYTRANARWKAAKQRCFDPNAQNFKHYGGRGITMCEEWANDFAAFFRDMGECPEGHTLDRIDVNRGYEPGNCRWVTQVEQVKNTRRNWFVEHEGQRMVAKDYAKLVGRSYYGVLRDLKAQAALTSAPSSE